MLKQFNYQYPDKGVIVKLTTGGYDTTSNSATRADVDYIVTREDFEAAIWKEAPEWANYLCQWEGKYYYLEGFNVGHKLLSVIKSNPDTLPDGHAWCVADAISQRPATATQHDPVNHPKHYQLVAGLEAIDVIRATLTPEQFKGYCIGNFLKYRLRAGEKDDAVQDLKKSNWYREEANRA